MKITFYSNATCVYEQDDFRILADPWLSESCFETAWVHETPLKTKPQDLLDVDALYISHLHQDHLDPETLKYFRRDIPIVTLKDKFSLCERKLKEMGFSLVYAIPDGWAGPVPPTTYELGPFRITMFAPFTKHPFHGSDIGNVVDSAMLIETPICKVLNCNDNLPDVESARMLAESFGRIDVAQINYNNAGPYPACFLNLTYEEKLVAHRDSIERNLAHMAAVGQAMKAKYIMPFAGSFKLSKRWEHLNEYLGNTTDRHAVAYLQDKGLRAFRLAEGESFDLAREVKICQSEDVGISEKAQLLS